MKPKLAKSKLIILTAGVVLSAGCIRVDVHQSISSTGSSSVEINNDFTQLAALGETNDLALGALPGLPNIDTLQEFQHNLETVCDDYLTQTNLQNPQCEQTDFSVSMTGEQQLTEPVFTVHKSLPYITYTYDAHHVFAILADTGGEQAQQLDEATIQQAKAGADLLGMELHYTVEMPAAITKATVGTVDDTQRLVTINIFDLVGDEDQFIIAQKINWPWIIITASVGVVFLLIVVTVLIRQWSRQHRPHP